MMVLNVGGAAGSVFLGIMGMLTIGDKQQPVSSSTLIWSLAITFAVMGIVFILAVRAGRSEAAVDRRKIALADKVAESIERQLEASPINPKSGATFKLGFDSPSTTTQTSEHKRTTVMQG